MHAIVTHILKLVHKYSDDGREMTFCTIYQLTIDAGPRGWLLAQEGVEAVDVNPDVAILTLDKFILITTLYAVETDVRGDWELLPVVVTGKQRNESR